MDELISIYSKWNYEILSKLYITGIYKGPQLKVGMEITNIFEDLRDGKRLIKLLELLTGEEMPKPNRGRMRIHKIENVDRALNFLRSFVMKIHFLKIHPTKTNNKIF